VSPISSKCSLSHWSLAETLQYTMAGVRHQFSARHMVFSGQPVEKSQKYDEFDKSELGNLIPSGFSFWWA